MTWDTSKPKLLQKCAYCGYIFEYYLDECPFCIFEGEESMNSNVMVGFSLSPKELLPERKL